MAKALNITHATGAEAGAVHIGKRFDAAFSEYLEIHERTEAVMGGFHVAIDAFKVPQGSPQFLRLLNTRCSGIVELQQAKALELDAITKIIRDMPISGPIAILVKAKALQFDAGLLPMKGPLNDWDWCEECLHVFLQQLSVFATGRAL